MRRGLLAILGLSALAACGSERPTSSRDGARSVPPPGRPPARNDIQIVTGVSTGALMATHAFVGGMDDTLGSEPVCPGAPRVSGQRPRFQ
jgi:hypothetical protein